MFDVKQAAGSKNRKGPIFWFAAFAVILAVAVVATFIVSGRSITGEWRLLAGQLGAAVVFSFPAGLLIAKVSNGCIVCRDDICEIEEQKNVRS